MKDLYIIGAGGFGKEVLWLIRRINECRETWNVKGFIDDNVGIHGTCINDMEVIGNIDYLCRNVKEAWVVCAVASGKAKRQIFNRMSEYSHIKFATIIDPSVIMSDRVKLGDGCIVCVGSSLTVDIVIGNHVTINLGCTVGHDVEIRDFVTLYPSVNLSGNVLIGECTEIGTGTQVIQGVTIGDDVIVGAGAVVINNAPAGAKIIGVPGKQMGERT